MPLVCYDIKKEKKRKGMGFGELFGIGTALSRYDAPGGFF